MLSAQQELIRKELENGTGAAIGMRVDPTGTRTRLSIWFSDLDERHGPVAELRPVGLKGYQVTLGFGTFAGDVVRQIRAASDEDVRLAQALLGSIPSSIELDLGGQDVTSWRVETGRTKMIATARRLPQEPEAALTAMCKDAIVPMMAAMAELIGYDVIEAEDEAEGEFEGAILISTVRRRERNPRNRLLCIRLHGEKCACCGFEPHKAYGAAGGIIEVHHLEALSLLSAPRPYNPATDLVPLCPNCHRAVHTRRPAPYSLEDIRQMLGLGEAREVNG